MAVVDRKKLVHEFDLLKTLENLNLKDRLIKGTLKCRWCSTQIHDPNEIALLQKKDNKIVVCCRKLDCIYRSQRDANG